MQFLVSMRFFFSFSFKREFVVFQRVLLYQWVEDSLSSGEKLSEDMYELKMESEEEYEAEKSKPVAENVSSDDDQSNKKMRSSTWSPPASKECVRISTHLA